MPDAARLAGLLAEPERRQVVAAMILGAIDVAGITRATGLEGRQVIDALDRLSTAGLVEVGADGTHVLLEEAFKRLDRASGEYWRSGGRVENP